MKNIKLLLLILIASISTSLFAQKVGNDVLYLKNGSVFQGAIVEYKQGGTIKFQINENSILEFQDDQIDKIVQGVKKVETRNQKMKLDGWYNETGFGINTGMTYYSDLDFGGYIHNTTGYQFNRYFGAGLGLGIDSYLIGGYSLLPIYSEFRSIPLGDSRNIAFSLKMGYGIALKSSSYDSFKGGMMISPEIKFRFPGGSRFYDWSLSIGYVSQKVSYENSVYYYDWIDRSQYENDTRYDVTMRRFKLGLNIDFWKK